jgi:hypothetical protein
LYFAGKNNEKNRRWKNVQAEANIGSTCLTTQFTPKKLDNPASKATIQIPEIQNQ